MSLLDACSGAAGGVFSVLVMCPLDLAKTRYQIYGKKGGDPRYSSLSSSLRTLLDEGGVAGLYTGVAAKCLQNAVMNFGQFYWMSLVKRSFLERDAKPPSALVSLSLNMVASMCNQATNTPCEVVSTRIAAGTGGTSIADTVAKVVREGGVRGLWKGLLVSLAICVNPAINYAFLDLIRPRVARYLARRRAAGSATAPTAAALALAAAAMTFTLWQSFWMGVVAKALTTILTFPIIRTKVILQAKGKGAKDEEGEGKGKEAKEGGALELMRDMYEREGILGGWYLGLAPQIANASFKSGLMVMTKDRIKDTVRSVFRKLALEK